LLLLAGVPRVKPDRMIRRFVADALQVADIGPQAVAQQVTAVQQVTCSPHGSLHNSPRPALSTGDETPPLEGGMVRSALQRPGGQEPAV
jgi:hypothetical protein